MDQQRMESTAQRSSKFHLFASFGPAVMIAMGYIDLGKCVSVVEAGSRFGYDLMLPVLLFNFSAILCQYLATCIGMVTGSNLAEICHKEYSKSVCLLLGVQAELSMLASDLSMIFGIAHWFNLLFGVDLLMGICFALVVANLLPYFSHRLDNWSFESLTACIAGFALVCYILGLLVSQPEVPLAMNVVFPKLSGESAYLLMALLGSNVMAHNFYVHSSVIQGYKSNPVPAIGAVFHDHLSAIFLIFSGIFIVNYVLMNSAAAVSSNAELLLNFQDVILVMDQIFRNPIAPVMLLVVLVFSSQIISLTCNIGGQMIMRHFFGIDLSLSGHHVLLNILIILPTIYSVKVAGAEGLYQLLIICQIMQAMLLPASVIPLFRIASSRQIMSTFKISWYLEISAFLAFLVMLFANIVFTVEMLFGDSSWIDSLKGNTESAPVVPYGFLLLISCASIVFTLFLAVTPLKSASAASETQEWPLRSQTEILGVPKLREEKVLERVVFEEDQKSAFDPVPKDSFECQPDRSALDYVDSSENAFEADYDSKADYDSRQTAYFTNTASAYSTEESKSVVSVDWTDVTDNVSTGSLGDEIIEQRVETKSTTEKDTSIQADVPLEKDKEELNLDPEKLPGGSATDLSYEGPPSLTSRGKASDGGNGSGSLRLSGLGRAARRQLAAILDEFWGHLFDYHGKLTQEASTRKYDVLLGLDSRVAGSSAKSDNLAVESSKNSLGRDTMMGSSLSAISLDLLSPVKDMSGMDLPYGLQVGPSPSPWSQSLQTQNSSNNLLGQSGKLYSNFNSPSYSDSQFYQPATIHGYELSSYLKGLNANRNPYASMPLDPQRPPKSSTPSTATSYGDSLMYARGQSQNVLGSYGVSGLQSQTGSIYNRMLTERSYYDTSYNEGSENDGLGAYSKKYHSSPDVSALIAAGRNIYMNEAKLGGQIGTQPYLSRLASDRAPYMGSSRAKQPIGTPLGFDGLSAPKLHRDVFSMQSSPSAESLWVQQPYEQLFSRPGSELKSVDAGPATRSSSGAAPRDDFSYAESEARLLKSFRLCIMKLLKLEGSGWLFKQNGGCEEDLIDQVAATEKLLLDATEKQLSMSELQNLPSEQRSNEPNLLYLQSLPNCGEDCIWGASLVVSFGVWCIRRILDMSLVESRPELWGKYTYVLNRLQGILDPAFSKPRGPIIACSCLQKDMGALNRALHNGVASGIGKPIRGNFTTASVVLGMIKDVEIAVSGRKGRTGTAAGDVAFPKGKENLASVLKRYKRRLSSKPSGGQ